jgi:hypothetical protein
MRRRTGAVRRGVGRRLSRRNRPWHDDAEGTRSGPVGDRRLPEVGESARAGSGCELVIRTSDDRWVVTCGAYSRRPNAIDAKWRSNSHFENRRKTRTSNLPSSRRAPGATVIPRPRYGPFETADRSARES